MTFVFKAYMSRHQKSWLNISKYLCFTNGQLLADNWI